MALCRNCGAEIRGNDKFCHECGANQAEVKDVERIPEEKSKQEKFGRIWYVLVLLPIVSLIAGTIFYFQERKDAVKLILASVIVWVIYAIIVSMAQFYNG